MDKCDCFIGKFGDDVRLSTLKKQIDDALTFQDDLRRLNMLDHDMLTAKDILDSRMGYFNKFNYCPYCGNKIDWKLIKQQL